MKKFITFVLCTAILGASVVAYAREAGDANNNGSVTSSDSAFVVQKVLDSSFEVDKDYNQYSDVNNDGKVDSDDAALIFSHVLQAEVELQTGETVTEITTEATTQSHVEPVTKLPEGFNEVPDSFDNTWTVSNYSDLVAAISQAENASGQSAIYITDDIYPSAQIKLAKSKANVSFIGITRADGTSPKLDFKTFRDTHSSTGQSGTGLMVSGSYYNFKNLIVTNTPDCGIRIKGNSAGNCILQDCVFKYNNNSGVSVTAGGANNTFIGVDCYRNCDLVQKLGGDADGFSVKLQAGDGNKFFACRAWENGDDGWDSYGHSGDLTYIECLCWHNGDYEIFSGKYDYNNNLPLDKDLIYIQACMAADPEFEAKYNAHTLTTWPNVKLSKFGKSITGSQINLSNWDGNPNGFKFASAGIGAEQYRLVENCIAFGNGQKGFDQNNGGCTIDIYNTIAYDNGYGGKNGQISETNNVNYQMDRMTVKNSKNNFTFNGANPDTLPSGFTTTEPTADQQTQIRQAVNNVFNDIKAKCAEDKIPGIVYFTDIFNIVK